MNNREIEEDIQKIMTVVKTPRYPEFIFDVHDAVTKLREIASQKFPDGNVDLYRHLSIVIASTKEADSCRNGSKDDLRRSFHFQLD